ncbi:hypothetical protein ACFLX9_04670 [Chloroflexota bacterium]
MAQQAEAPFDGRNATITAPDTSVDVVEVPEDRVMRITRFHVSNNNPSAARVRFWDEFTDSDGDVHDAVTNPVLLADYNVQPGETVDVSSELGLAKAIGKVIAQSTVAGADPNDVTAGAWGVFE